MVLETGRARSHRCCRHSSSCGHDPHPQRAGVSSNSTDRNGNPWQSTQFLRVGVCSRKHHCLVGFPFASVVALEHQGSAGRFSCLVWRFPLAIERQQPRKELGVGPAVTACALPIQQGPDVRRPNPLSVMAAGIAHGPGFADCDNETGPGGAVSTWGCPQGGQQGAARKSAAAPGRLR